MTAFQFATQGEARVARAIVRKALAAGYTVSVHDGEEFAIKRSTSQKAIEAAMCSTGQDTLFIRENGERVGCIELIYGNEEDGSELVSDHWDNEKINALL